jgi:hypothetical protein
MKDDTEPGRERPGRGGHRGDRIRPRRPGRPGQHRIRRQRPAPPGEHHPDRLHPACETSQPAAHRPRRPPQQHRDPAVPDPGRPRHEHRPDQSGGVRASDQQQHRQQHMRRPAAGAPRPPRHDPNRTVRAADRPGPSPAPPGEHTRASRTRQPPRSQAFLDPGGVGLYREHRASEPNHTALPHAFGQRRTAGGPWPTPTRRSSRWRRRRTRSTRLARQHADRLAQRRQPSTTLSS